ncbi:MAG: LapA family protein [Pseudorhodoplanes sp.]
MKKFLMYLVLVPLVAALVLFAVANREIVTLSVDPFDAKDPTLAIRLPLYAVIFLCLLAGVLIGGAAAWLRQGSYRRSARNLQSEVTRLRREAEVAAGLQPAPAPRIASELPRIAGRVPS